MRPRFASEFASFVKKNTGFGCVTPTRDRTPLRRPWEALWPQNRAKSCQGRPFGLHGKLESESENGNPGSKYVARTG